MNLKIHNINPLSTPWLKLHGCEIASPEAADFIIYEQLTDHVADEVNNIKNKYQTEKIVFILSGDINISDDKHIWFQSEESGYSHLFVITLVGYFIIRRRHPCLSNQTVSGR